MQKVLIVDDDPVMLRLASMILSKHFHTVTAASGKEALEIFEKEKPDLVLSDLRMPEMNGLEATKAIRELDREDAKKIPIIALTANAFDEDVQLSLQAGMNAHLSKPVQPDTLFATLEEML